MSVSAARPDETRVTGTPDHGRPLAPSRGRWRPLGLDEVRIDGGFWGDLQRLNATAMIEHCETWIERTGWAANFDAAATGALPAARRGREFSDSEVYKLLEDPAFQPFAERDALFRPDFAAVRADPRFMAVAAKLGLVRYWRQSGYWPDFCTSEKLAYDCKAEAAKYPV